MLLGCAGSQWLSSVHSTIQSILILAKHQHWETPSLLNLSGRDIITVGTGGQMRWTKSAEAWTAACTFCILHFASCTHTPICQWNALPLLLLVDARVIRVLKLKPLASIMRVVFSLENPTPWKDRRERNAAWTEAGILGKSSHRAQICSWSNTDGLWTNHGHRKKAHYLLITIDALIIPRNDEAHNKGRIEDEDSISVSCVRRERNEPKEKGFLKIRKVMNISTPHWIRTRLLRLLRPCLTTPFFLEKIKLSGL